MTRPALSTAARASTLHRAAARIWILVKAVAALLCVLCALPVAAAHAHCIEELQAEIVDRYARTYHQHWSEGMRRAPIEILMVGLATDARKILQKYGNPRCRFSVTVGRELPRESWWGPRLSPHAEAVAALVEFAADGQEVCVGFNNKHEIGSPTEDANRYPYEERPIPGNPLGTPYDHYAMLCIGEDGDNGRYVFY